jgi:photosystem II stability/assembly factor-like uncharacterized protein
VPSQKVNAITVDPVTPQNVYLAGPGGLFRSADGGLTWATIRLESKAEALALTLDPHDPKSLFALLSNGTLLFSQDQGATWATREVAP